MPSSSLVIVQELQKLLILFILLISSSSTTSSTSIAKPGCSDRCRNVSVPYPFGIGPSCYHSEAFEVKCGDSFGPLILLNALWSEVLQFSQDYIRFSAWSLSNCYNKSNGNGEWHIHPIPYLTDDGPFTFSSSRSMLTAVGCDIFAYIPSEDGQNYVSGCASFCTNSTVGNLSSCSGGNGCCQTTIPKGLKSFLIRVESINTYNRSWISNPCSHAIVVDKEFSGFIDLAQSNQNLSKVPMMLDWAIGNITCKVAQRNLSSYACGLNTYCVESENGSGYRCNCSKGYAGNPYLLHGCEDIDECKDSSQSTQCLKEALCLNTPGSYSCACPSGYNGDGKKLGIGCTRDKKRVDVAVVASLGVGIGILLILLFAMGFWLHHKLEKTKQTLLKQKHFKRNGGLLLKQRISSNNGRVEQAAKIFLTGELERATDNFNQSRIIGNGGFGTVYKGMLSDGKIVAIKKSKLVDENQVDQFINELTILSQINHRHIVKLLGCCLETEVPLLVYEYVSNGTLSYHLRGECGDESSIPWKDRLRIAAEIAGALAYLHSEASIPILHRDIKSSNILLDENYGAKVSDFGISRSIPIDKTHLTTRVQGTFGYLDPEYFHTGQYTDKCDVYSFGVVLVELLTGEKDSSLTNLEDEKSLALHFTSSMKNNHFFEILDARLLAEANKDEVLVVAKLAKRCVKLNGKKRPNMKEVAASLDGLRNFQDYPRINKQELQPVEDSPVLGDHVSPSYQRDTSIGGFDTITFEAR